MRGDGRRAQLSLLRGGLVVLLALASADLLAGAVALAIELDDHAHSASLVRRDGHAHIVFSHARDASSSRGADGIPSVAPKSEDHVVDIASAGDAIRSQPRVLDLHAHALVSSPRVAESNPRASHATARSRRSEPHPAFLRTVVLRL